jgi:hypothetical protein
VIDVCLSSAVSGLLHDNEADEDTEADAAKVVHKPADKGDSEVVERLLDLHVNECANAIDYVASEGGNMESLSVEGHTDGSDDCLAATSSPLPMHRCSKSRGGTTNHSTMTRSMVVSTSPNWLQRSDKVI